MDCSPCASAPPVIRLPLCGPTVLTIQADKAASPLFDYGTEELVFVIEHPIFPASWSRKIVSPADGLLKLPVEHVTPGVISRYQPVGIKFFFADGKTPLNVTEAPLGNCLIIQHAEPMLEPALIPADPPAGE